MKDTRTKQLRKSSGMRYNYGVEKRKFLVLLMPAETILNLFGMTGPRRRARMAKFTWRGSLKPDDPIFTKPCFFGSVRFCNPSTESSQKNTVGETQASSQSQDTKSTGNGSNTPEKN